MPSSRRQFLRDSSLLAGLASHAGAQADDGAGSIRAGWPADESSLFFSELLPGAGFSFTYRETTVGPSFRAEWKVSSESSPGGARVVFRHETGLVVTREAVFYPEYEAIEYTVRFRNESGYELPALADLNAIDLSFGAKSVEGLSVVSSSGGMVDSLYPPDVFAIRRRYFAPMTPVSGQVLLTTIGGRSSDKDMPFFFLESAAHKEGMFVAVGWSGQWIIRIVADLRRNLLQVRGGMAGIHIQVAPGEEISGPRILMGCYRGPLANGSNRLRRLIRERYTPLLGCNKPQPPVTYDHWWNIGLKFDEPLLRQLADRAAFLEQEYFLLDAGWYAGTKPDDFGAGLGNWDQPDQAKFPNGMEGFAKYVATKGLGFGLWLEPERVARGSHLAREHPEWIIWRSETPGQKPPDPSVYATQILPVYGLLNYGLPKVREYVVSMVDRMVRGYGIRYIRYDCNIAPLIYWESVDQPHRRGAAQIRHVEGLYEVLERIRKLHPDLLLEGCASGGRRIDLQTARHFHSFWISDHTSDPHIVRWHLHGIQHFLPGNYAYACYVLPLPNRKQFDLSDLSFQSFFGGAFGTGGRIDEWPAELAARARTHVRVYKTIRKYLLEDFFPLTPQPQTLESWQAWQFHDPRLDEGFVQIFRLESTEEQQAFVLKALNASAVYQCMDAYTLEMWKQSGRELTSEGIKLAVPRMASRVVLYRKTG